MSKVVVMNSVTLDGVMQAPGRPEEDTREGFPYGGWAERYMDDQAQAAMQTRVAQSGGFRLLLGRRSYEDMLGYWNTQDSPFKEGLNGALKYVVSQTLHEPLPWPNSTLLDGDVGETVAKLKRDSTVDLTVMGSGELLQALMHQDLVDEYMLFIVPVVLGAGRRLFPEGSPSTSLRLVNSTTTRAGVIIATYQRS